MSTVGRESVCVCIAAYNAEGTIARAVRSALAQAYVSQVLVVDDGSRDGTVAAAREGDDGSARLHIIELKKNMGPGAARNRALEIATADLFCVLDSDDYFLPGRIESLLSAQCGPWDFLADDILIVPEGRTPSLAARPVGARPELLLDLDVATFVRSNVSRPGAPRAELGFLKPLIRRQFLEEAHLVYDPAMRLGEDYALYVRALMAGARFKVVSFCGYIAIERATSLSSSHRAADLAAILDFDHACARSPDLSPDTRRALADHQQATRDKWVLARALEIRLEQGVGAALRFLMSHAGSARYAATQILQARLGCRRSGASDAPVERPLIGARQIAS